MAKIRHIVFHTTDVERLAKFYVDVMGLKIVHRAKNGGISLTDGYINLSIHTNKMDGKPSGFNHFGFLVEDNEEIVERCEQLGYRAPQRRPATATMRNTGRLIRTETISIFRRTASRKSAPTPPRPKRASLEHVPMDRRNAVGWAKAARRLRLLHHAKSAVPTRKSQFAERFRVGTAQRAPLPTLRAIPVDRNSL
jgi:catechol 2,3-dioxygenase-like lactoylglutathione lyase family enzyme